MKKLIIILSIIFSDVSFSQNDSDIIIGKKITIKSAILKSEREISVYLPESYESNNYVHYPVLYLLDGKKFFHSFSGVVAQLSSDASPQIPEMIVIGITSQDRIKDSSPTHSLLGYSGKKEKGFEVSGGADDFLNFINKELIPFVDNKYRSNSYRILVGYSFTGLPVIHSLFTHPDTFDSYLIIDFSAWWDNEMMLKRSKIFLKEYKGKQKDVFLTTVDRVANTLFPEKINAGWTFIREFERNLTEHISFGYKKYMYKTENHHSMPLMSFIDGLKYIFRGHMINSDEMYSNPSLIESRFNTLSKRLGYEIFLSEGLINFLGYQFLYTNQDLEKALFYFKYNTDNYPLSSNAWDSLAELYKIRGDTNKASKYYKKAKELSAK